jgi:FkbM family methyltransferase
MDKRWLRRLFRHAASIRELRDDASTFVDWHEGWPRITVPIMTLNEVVAFSGAGLPEMVKIDAEGFDLKVLAGASDLLGKTDIFLVEAVVCSR